jgi:AraC-like DNA-binding protein
VGDVATRPAAPAARFDGARGAAVVGTPRREVRPWLARDHAGYDEGTAPHRLLMPATAAVPLVLKMVDSPHRPPAFAVGAHDSYREFYGACAPSYLEVRLAPLGAYTLLGLPLDELSGQLVDLVDLVGAAGAGVAERIRDARSWDRRFAIMDEFLLRRMADGPRPAPEVVRAWQRIGETAGAVPIGQLADDVGWSHRHLIAMFKRQIGVAPRTAARIVRFERVLGRVDRRSPVRWGALATELGYADQAHLIRDFRSFTGTTPTAFTAEVGSAPLSRP